MRVIKGLQISIIFILLIIIILIVLASLTSVGDYQLKVVQSGSMEPAIKTGSLVVVSPAQEYEKGDIITFSLGPGEGPTTHRIDDVKIIEGELAYTTKGDANKSADLDDVFKEDIVGKVWFSVPYAGYLIDFAKSPLGFAFLLAIPAGVIIYDQVQKIIKKTRKKDSV